MESNTPKVIGVTTLQTAKDSARGHANGQGSNVHELPVGDDRNELVPEGEYELAYVDYYTRHAFKGSKVVVRFRILNHGAHFGTVVERFYRVTLRGAPRKRGHFVPPLRGDCFREFCRLFPGTKRRDRISYARLNHHIVIGKVKIVTVDSKQNELIGAARYNVIESLLRIAR